MSDGFQLLVLGGGPAGFATVRSYRDAGGTGPVALVSDEGRMPYNRPPLTKELLRGDPVVVVGSGFIGCEIASSLRMRGHPVTLVSDEPAPNQARLSEGPASAFTAAWS